MRSKPKYCQAGYMPYLEAQALMHVSFQRLVEAQAGVRAWRVAGAVWCLTAAYSKPWDQVYVATLAAMTGMPDSAVRQGIKECVEAGAIQWKRSKWHNAPSLIGLPNTAREEGDVEANTAREEGGLEANTARNTARQTGDYQEPREQIEPTEVDDLGSGERRCSMCPRRDLVEGSDLCHVCHKRWYKGNEASQTGSVMAEPRPPEPERPKLPTPAEWFGDDEPGTASADELAAQVEAELDGAAFPERFDQDNRGDLPGDSERELLSARRKR